MTRLVLPFALVAALTACSSDADEESAAGSGASSSSAASTGAGGGGAFSYEVTVTAEATAGAEAIVVWSVSATSPDYVYRFGDASIGGTGNQYVVSFPSDPPAEALNVDQIGIGYVLLLAPGTPLPPPGKIVDWNAVESAMIGATTRHAVIFKKGVMPPIDWAEAFPEGYACGACVPATSGFDSYEPIECSALELELPSDPSMLDFCNWT